VAWTENQKTTRNSYMYFVIKRKIVHAVNGEPLWIPVKTFAGADGDFAMEVYKEMEKIYKGLPEFGPTYFKENYVLAEEYFEKDSEGVDSA
jgi:hypothetical protein